MSTVEINQGEIKLNLTEQNSGVVTLESLGVSAEDLFLKGGLLRLTIDLGAIAENKFFKTPTAFFAYEEEVSETAWQCDYNSETVLEKTDHHGKTTVILIDRNKLENLHHRHINTLIIHAEFPEAVHINPKETYIRLF